MADRQRRERTADREPRTDRAERPDSAGPVDAGIEATATELAADRAFDRAELLSAAADLTADGTKGVRRGPRTDRPPQRGHGRIAVGL